MKKLVLSIIMSVAIASTTVYAGTQDIKTKKCCKIEKACCKEKKECCKK